MSDNEQKKVAQAGAVAMGAAAQAAAQVGAPVATAQAGVMPVGAAAQAGGALTASTLTGTLPPCALP